MVDLELFLHIGSPKTGTSSVQRFLKWNRKDLRKHGILYPVAFGNKLEKVLPDLIGGLDSKEGQPKSRDEHADKVGSQLREELAEGEYHKVIFSSEFLWTKAAEVEQIEFLRAFLANFFPRIYIIAYLRRQDEYVSSAWSTAVKGGETKPFSNKWLTSTMKQKIHYWKILSRWAQVFGQDNMIVRKYELSTLRSEDIVEDFLVAARIDPALELKRVPSRNVSLDADALEFLRLLNRNIPHGDRPPMLLPTLAEISKGPRMALSDDAADEFQATFRESNRKIAYQYFGGEIDGSDDPLFMPRVAEEKVTADHRMTAERAVEIAAVFLQKKEARAKASLAVRAKWVGKGNRRRRVGKGRKRAMENAAPD